MVGWKCRSNTSSLTGDQCLLLSVLFQDERACVQEIILIDVEQQSTACRFHVNTYNCHTQKSPQKQNAEGIVQSECSEKRESRQIPFFNARGKSRDAAVNPLQNVGTRRVNQGNHDKKKPSSFALIGRNGERHGE